MENKTFVITNGKIPVLFCLAIIFLLIYFFFSKGIILLLSPLFMLITILVIGQVILFFKWIYCGYVIKVDEEKKEMILNHNLAFFNKTIAMRDIDIIDSKKEEIIITDPMILSKWQRRACKASNYYRISFQTLSKEDRSKLFNILLTLNESKIKTDDLMIEKF